METQSTQSDNKIRVLFVSASTRGGGAERMLFNIIRSLDEKHQARLFITSDQTVPDVYSSDVEAINANKKHAFSAFFKLLGTMKHFKPRHVFTTSGNIGYLLVIAKKLLRAKFKIYIRCAVPPSEIYQRDIKTRLLSKIISMTYNSADMIIAQTDYSRHDLIKAYKLQPNKVHTIRNIVDHNFIASQATCGSAPELKTGNYNIIAVGALYSVKGFDILIEAITPLLRDDQHRHLYIIGEERYELGYRQILQQMIDDRDLSNQIHLLGHKQNPHPYMKAADLLVMSSRKEGFPNVVLEALSLGTPVVATDVVDFTDVIIEGVNGYVSHKGSTNQLSLTIKKAFTTTFSTKSKQLRNFDYNELFC